MSKLSTLLLFLLLFSLSLEAQEKPNIIVIYTDDQGYGDVSALNAEAKFKTPNLDKLISEGIAFTNGHSSSSICTPSRYGLLTGRYSWRTYFKKSVLGAESKCLIEDGRMTLASLLKSEGYTTGMVGKWHLGMDFPGELGNRDWTQPVQDMPLDKGFDYFYGIPASLNYGVLAWFEGRYAKVPPTMHTYKKENPRHSDYIVAPPYNNTIAEVKKYGGKKILEVAPDFIDSQCLTRFTTKAMEWMDTKLADSKNGKPFFLYLPYTSPHYPVSPLPEFKGQGDAGAYGEFVIETDYHVGQIMNYLKENGIDKNTLVVFTSDNGPENSWASRIKEFNHDSRGGFKEGKRSVYEGGHRVPFILHWPAGIKNPGRQWDKPVGQTDLLATFADLLDVKLPNNAGEDSESFASVLDNPKTKYNRLPLINRGDSGSRNQRYSITEGDWKLNLPTDNKPAELYNLAQDPSESNNIADSNQKRVISLTKKMNAIVVNGRTTKGVKQANDTGYWDDLAWMTPQEYATKSKKSSENEK